MPVFKYSGFKTDGTSVSGVIEASGTADALARIKAEGILPADIKEPHLRRGKRFFQRTDEAFLPNMTRQLSILLSSGVPLMDALQSLADEYKGFYREMLIAVKEHVSAGAGLWRALEDFGEFFPEFYIHMVQAGEQSGTLEKVLIKLAGFLESRNSIREKVRSAMIYPVIMTGVGMVVLSFLFTFVIPKMVRIFENAHGALPFITIVLIFISNVFINYWWAIFGGLAVFYFLARRFIQTRRQAVDSFLLRLPGNIIQSLYYARFSRTLGFLVEGGIPVLKALRLSSKSMGNKALEQSVLTAEERVAQGQSLSASLDRFPPVLIRLISTGEKSGRLAETLNMAADAYEDEFNRNITKGLSVFEPLLILTMGIIVGFVVLAVMLPIFQLNQLIK